MVCYMACLRYAALCLIRLQTIAAQTFAIGWERLVARIYLYFNLFNNERIHLFAYYV